MIRVNNTVGRAALTVAALLCLWPAVISCVKEDYSDCPPDDDPFPPVVDSTKTFRFKLTHDQTDVAVTPADMKDALVYIFNDRGTDTEDDIVAVASLESPEFDVVYETDIKLPVGGYEVVVWINPGPPYSLYPGITAEEYGTHSKADGRMTLTLPENKIITEDLPYQLWGGALHSISGSTYNPAVDPEDQQTPEDEVAIIPMYLNNYIVSVSTQGLPADTDSYSFRIKDDNDTDDFNNKNIAGDDFYYHKDASFVNTGTTRADGVSLQSSVNILSIDDGDHPEISLVNTTESTTLYPAKSGEEVDLISLIQATGRPLDFLNIHRYDIVLDFTDGNVDDKGNMTPTIWINGWRVVEDDYTIIGE